MKLKQFIFALVAMLSFSFSSFAQSTVSTAEGLKAALESTTGGEVVLGGDITLPAQITVPKKTAHTLDLNGHKITGGIYVYGTLTINDNVGTGSITASTYVLNGAGGSKIILNGGRIYRGSSWSVYTTGVFTVNGGEVENTIRVAGSGSIQLNGGTVTAVQVTSGNLNIAGDAVVEGTLNIEKGAKGVNIADGTINGDITIANEATDKVTVSGGTFKDADAVKDYLPGGSALLEKPDGTFEIVAGLLKIGDTYYPTLAAALAAAADGATIELINQEGSVIAMNGSLYGKSVTITGTATVDWSKGFLFVARGGEGDATLTFDNAQLTSASNSASYGIHVSGREKNTADKYDGKVVIKNNSTIELDYLINKGAMTLDNSSLTVKNGFDLNGRPAKETENGEDANATLALNNNSKLVVNNHNGMGIGREGKGELTVDATSTFEHTQDFLVCANGTMDVKGTLVSNGKKLTNNGEVKFTATKLTDANIEGAGTTRFYNDVNFYGANSITTTGINGTPFHLVVNEGANLFITRFVLGYDRNITVKGTIADASTFNPEGQTPSLKFNSTSGVSVGGTGTGNLTVKNAYIELGNSSWKNAQGTYDWDFVNSYVSATSFTNATGADAATWDVTFDNSVLAAKNYIKNGKNVTYNFTNNSRGTTGSLRIDGVLNIDPTSSVVTTSQQNNVPGAVDEHGGINGTVNVAGNLTIGSNAKTQLEVLGGKVNVVEGATLALGNNTMTLDASSAMQSAGNISGAITAADGANVAISGGTYTQDVSNWCADGFMTQQNADGSFGIAKAVAKVGDKKYATLEEAFKAATSGCTIEIVSDVTVDYAWDARNTGAKFTVPVTIDGNGKTIKFTNTVYDGGNYLSAFRFEAAATVNDLTIDMSEAQSGFAGRFRAISAKDNLTVDGCTFIGNGSTNNTRAIIFGEGAGANAANLAIAITNSTFNGWKRGISDNENAQDVKTVTITGNTLTDAGVGVSAKEKVTFTGNTVSGAYVNIKSYTDGNKLAVTATGNTLEANTDAAYNVIDAGGVVNAEGFNIVAKGNDFNGYTSADAIWGEVWGNARKSFVIKVLDANGNVMGTTSLNNIGGIIDGDVNVSWNLKFNAAANTDEYWTMEWTTAPSISNMPAKVALWVDGTRVSGGDVVLNGPDDLNKIVAAVTDADGKIISCHTSVESAADTKATNIALLRETTEEIELPVGTILNKNGFTAAGVTVKPVAKVGNTEYASIDAAIAAWTNNTTLTLLADVTLSDVIQLSSTEMHTLDLGTFTMTAASKKDAIQIVNNGRSSAGYALDIKADANNPGGITATGKAVVRTTGKSGVKDRPIIRFYNGVFTGTNVIYHSGSNGTNCPQFQFHGGVFNGTVYANRALIQFYGGTFNGSLQMSVDSSAYALVAGGRFKQLSNLYMSALNKDKFTIGSAKGVFDREVYIDEEGYYVVAKTEPAEGIEADVAKKPGTNDYLAYSKVGTEGQLGYTDVETALKNNTSATVTVYADEVDMSGIDNFKGTIIVPVGETVKISNAPANLKVESADGYVITPNATNEYVSIALVAKIGETIYDSFEKAVAAAQANETVAIHKAGTYKVPQGKNLTITGAVEGVKFANIGAHNMGGASMTFNNVTFEYGNENYMGLQHSGNLVYNNCTFNGQVFLYGQSETFNKCTFNQTSADAYNVWTYAAKEVAFNECTFNSAGKSVLIYHEDAAMFNDVAVTNSTFNASGAVAGKAAIEMDASLTAGINLTIDAATTATGFAAGNVSGNSLWNNKKGNADEANNDITVKVGDDTVLAPVYEAKIGEKNYRNLQDAINAVQDSETITMLLDVTANITLTEKVGLHYTLDGAGKTMNGKITITPLSDENDNRRITIMGINFVNTADAAVDFISCNVTNHYPRLTVEGCTFTGNGKATDVALRLKTAYGAVIKDCTGTGLHSFLQNTAGKDLTIENVKVTESKSAFALGTVQGVTIKGCEADVQGYGIRLDANTYNNNAVIESNKVTASIPVVVRKVNTQSNVTFEGENTFTASNEAHKWMVIGEDEYEAGMALPAEVAAGNVVVALNGTNLSYDGVHGAGLAGEGTAEKPYLINNVAELEIFRNSVNAGSTKYNKDGLCVALNADIDMDGNDWSVNIGDDCANTFDGIFDGKNHTIKNLASVETAQKADGYICTGLFGAIGGNAVVKNFTIENVTINTADFTGNNVAAVVGFAYNAKGSIENVKVTGNININAKNALGVGAILGYDYYSPALVVKNCEVKGNTGSAIVGLSYVGGAVGYASNKIQLLENSVENVNITANNAAAGGVAGIMLAGGSAADNAVKNVALASNHANWKNAVGVVAGTITTGKVTIANTTIENVNTDAVAGAIHADKPATPVAKVEARIGDAYYTTFAAAYTAAKAGETVTMLTDLNMSEILVINKAITLDGNGKKLTSTAGRAINVDCEGNVGIKNLTINASDERAINVINKPANVTIEGVTATAANYTVNVATSAGAAKVAITGSNLTGLNVVNVTAPGAEVTINGGTITCNDQTDAEYYAALNLTKEAVGAKIAATSDVTFDIKGDSKKASNGAVDGVITIGGSTDEVDVIVAYIQYGNYYNSYTSIEAAIAKAKDGETIGLIRDVNLSEILVINKAITLDGNGKKLTSAAERAINVSGADGVTIKNLTIDAKGERAINVIQNATNVTIEKVTATAANYTVNIAGSAANAVVAINNSTLNGLCTVNVSAAGAKVTVDKSTVNCNDNNTTAGEAYAALSLNKEAVGGSIVATNTIVNVAEGSDSMKGRNSAENGTVTINGSTDGVAVMVAVITYEGSVYYHSFSSLAEAVEFAKAGDVITLIRDVTTSDIITINKNVAIDGNGKTLTYTGTDRAFQITGGTVVISNLTVDMPETTPEGSRGINLYNGGSNAALDVTLNNVTVNGYKAYAVNIGGGKDNKLTINGSTLTGYAAINVNTASENHTIVVDGSTLNGKNHNNDYSFGTVVVDGTNAHSLTITNTTITTENLEGVTSKYDKIVVSANCTLNWDGGEAAVRSIFADSKKGKLYYTDLQTAINDAAEVSGTVQILGNITATKSIAIPAAKKVTIDLNGKTITGTDNGTASYGLININPGAELTINDATGNGAIKLTATQNRGWNAYSSVISNQRGKLTVNGGTIEHLGGTDMAYAIDNLTNGKGTYAETIINGGTVKSTYRAIRQFLNGTEAQNILTVNGGTIEGTNKSIWMQDPSANANTGSLSVAADAELNGDVYLFVTAGSTEWPVSVSIAADALQGESKVVTGNVPAGYDVAEVNGAYGVYTGVAKIGTAYYETLKAAVEAAQAGETITLIDNVEATEVILLGKSLTINGNGHKVTSNATRVFRATTSNTEITLNDVNMVNTAVRVGTNDIRGISVDDVQNVKLTLNNCSVDFTDASANDWTYAVNVVGGSGHVVTVNGGAYEGANVINVRGANQTVTVKDATLTSLYPNNGLYFGACIYVVQNENSSVVATGNTFNGDNAKAFNVGYTPVEESDNIDNTKYVVAMIGDAYYTSIQDAVEAAQNGETIKLTQNVKMDTKTLATQNDGYAVLVNVNGKKVTLDLNGKKVTVNAAAADLAAAKGKMLLTVFHADTNGELTLTDNTADKAGAVVVNVNDATVYSVFASESQYSDKSESGKLTVNAGNYTTVGKVANAMFFTDANEVITVNGGNFHCDQVSNTANYPWMFNTLGNNELHVTVNGGTFNVDINHQHRPFEVKVPETLAVKANGGGTWTVVPAEAYITEMLGATVNEAGEWGHKVGYATIAEAIAAVNELGNKVSIAKDLELTEAVVVPADKTVVLDLNGKTVTMNDASGATAVLLKNNGNLTIMDGTEAKAGKLSFKTTTPSAANAYASNTISNYGILTIESGNVENLSVGGGACYALDSYAGSTVTINGGKLTAEKTAVRIFNWTNGEEAKATINMNGGEINSKNGYGINVNSGNAPFVALNIAGGTITTDYADYKLAVYVVNKGTAENFTANVTGGTFNGIFALNGVTAQTMKQGAVAVSGGTFEGVTCYDDPAYGFVSGGTFKSVVDAKAVATGFICKDNGDGTFGVIVDPKHGMVAQIIRNDYYAENQYFATINEAVQAAVSGETVTLIADVETSAAGYATITDGYAVIVAVKEKEITLDLNGKSVTVTPTADELAGAKDKMLMSVFGMDANGKLTLTGDGSVKVNANGANVYSLVAAYGEGSAVVIENGNYEADAVMASGSLIYSHELITVMGGTFNLGNIATGANGSPWIFNTIGQNYTGVKVVGGTYPTDINHQFWANEVLVPEAYALKNNGNGTWTVVDAVAYTNEKATSRGASWRHVGYASLEDAIAATGKYNCQDNTVTMNKDITLAPITVANGVTVAIDLNGKTISGTDSGTASFGLITNKGDLTINGTGAITLKATQDRGWGAYSSVISNQVGGKLTVNGGTIQHLGGTSMAYAIDNLTNGKGTYAETEINGGEIKSTYRPIRMFLNGTEADNILTVNAGTIESTGGNKAAIWMQTAGDVAHSGTLYVGERAVIKNNVYLDADNLKNVREYPVEAYIAKAALAENMTVLADNIPAEAAALVEYDTFWQVEQKNLAALTIEDDCEEYINKIEKNVGVLTYERYFDDTEWQTIVLPFDVPVANLMEQFEVAYIYNASYKGKQATIDYVVIEDSEFVLAANYPYMIRAKEAGWNNIVVEDAKLMPTEVEILDCSSIFEKFSFIGNYATVDADTLDAKMGYFNLTSGAWSKMDVVNPFRFYMQIKLRNGGAFEYPTEAQAIRMRSVNANGEETTGINGVDAEQAGDFIFDLHGRRVLEPEKGGIYIVNGKKVMF